MTKITDKQAHEKLVKARTVLLVTQPFWGCLALHLELVELPEDAPMQFKTMAVDGVHLYYFPCFVKKITDQELVAVVAHEVSHCCFKHMTRRGHRNPVIWNMAGDFLINSMLHKATFVLPNPHLYDAKYDALSTEEIYERIKDEVQKQLKQKQQGKGKGQGSKGQKKGQRQGNEQGDGDEDGEGGGISIPDTDLDIDPGMCGGVMDAAGPAEKHKSDGVEREWDANVRMAVNVAKRANAGTVPGYLERLISQLKEARVSWRELTRQFIDTSMTKDYSWSRPNRRSASTGNITPGFIADALHHMVFAVDTSGSIDMAMLTAFLSEISGALNDGTADKLTVVYADTRVAHVDEYMTGDVVKCEKIHGGGGTCFNNTMEWIKTNAPDAQCVVYLTDMLTSSFGEDPGMPVLWACYLPKASLDSINPPFGMKIAVDTSE
jgi:predicted metal-dependent peptidase